MASSTGSLDPNAKVRALATVAYSDPLKAHQESAEVIAA